MSREGLGDASSQPLSRVPTCPLCRTRFCNSSSARSLLCWRPGCAVVLVVELEQLFPTRVHLQGRGKHVNHITARWPGMSREGLGDASSQPLSRVPACPLFRTRFCNSSSAWILLCWRPGCAVVLVIELEQLFPTRVHLQGRGKHVNHITARWPGMSREGLADV